MMLSRSIPVEDPIHICLDPSPSQVLVTGNPRCRNFGLHSRSPEHAFSGNLGLNPGSPERALNGDFCLDPGSPEPGFGDVGLEPGPAQGSLVGVGVVGVVGVGEVGGRVVPAGVGVVVGAVVGVQGHRIKFIYLITRVAKL